MHWSEVMSCSCGKTFRSYASEARHRHNFPMLCRPAKKPKQEKEVRDGREKDGAGEHAPAAR